MRTYIRDICGFRSDAVFCGRVQRTLESQQNVESQFEVELTGRGSLHFKVSQTSDLFKRPVCRTKGTLASP